MSSEINFQDIKLNFDLESLQVFVKQMNYGIFTESYTRHSHGKNYYELHLVCGGKGTLLIGQDSYPLQQGSLYMTGPELLHEQQTDKQDPMQEYCLGFELRKKKNQQDTEFTSILLETTFWLGEDNGECSRLFSLLSKESTSRLLGCTVNMQNAVSSILVELVRHYTGNRKGNDFVRSVPDDRRLNLVDGYFLYNYATASEEGLGTLLGLSTRRVQRFLKKNYGKTFSEMKREARLNKSNDLMQRGIKLDDVAAMVGYNSVSFFRKLQKQNPTR